MSRSCCFLLFLALMWPSIGFTEQLLAQLTDKAATKETKPLTPQNRPAPPPEHGRTVPANSATVEPSRAILLAIAAADSSKPGAEIESISFVGKIAGDRRELTPAMKFRWCPPTTEPFQMGTPEPTDDETVVSVTLTKGFWLGETEVTQGQWVALMESTPWRGRDHVKEGPEFAATNITHGELQDGTITPDSACAFCQKLTEHERKAQRLPPGWRYALPTEAQWEYACRAGTKTKFSFGDDENLMSQYAWYYQNTLLIGDRFAHQVGLKLPNAWGLHDMHGNVSEWCADWYQQKLPGGSDPVVLLAGSYRVRRGGSWKEYTSNCGSSNRVRFSPVIRYSTLGFRVAAVSIAE